MNIDNYDYLAMQLKYLGFGNALNGDLESKIKAGTDNFSLKTTIPYSSFDKKDVSYELNFRKGNEDIYFFNSYKAMVGEKSGLFYVNKGEKNITSKEAFNLLETRFVHRELTNKDGGKYNAWQKIDKWASGPENTKFRTFSDGYGFDLDAALREVTARQLFSGQDRDQVLQSLQKGNLVPMTNLDKSEKYLITPDPEFKMMRVYDEKGKELKLSDINKEQVAEGEKQSAGMKI